MIAYLAFLGLVENSTNKMQPFSRSGRMQAIIAGRLPRRASKLLAEWINLHRVELLVNWRAAANNEPVFPIDPLE